MSVSLTMMMPDLSGDSPPRYTVEHRGRWVLVFGALPISMFSALAKGMPKSAVVSPRIAMLAGANLATGPAEDMAALEAELAPQALARARQQYAGRGLSEAAVRWLGVGQRGLSSEAMFAHLSGVLPVESNTRRLSAYPDDADSLARCRLLLEEVPELAPRLQKMAEVSGHWAAVVQQWHTLCNIMDEDTPAWRSQEGKTSSRVSELLREIASKDAQCSRPRQG